MWKLSPDPKHVYFNSLWNRTFQRAKLWLFFFPKRRQFDVSASGCFCASHCLFSIVASLLLASFLIIFVLTWIGLKFVLMVVVSSPVEDVVFVRRTSSFSFISHISAPSLLLKCYRSQTRWRFSHLGHLVFPRHRRCSDIWPVFKSALLEQGRSTRTNNGTKTSGHSVFQSKGVDHRYSFRPV